MTSSLSETNADQARIDSIKQRQQGRGQTLVLMNGCNGQVSQTTSAASASAVWPGGFTHYQIPTQGNAVYFREAPSTYSNIMPVNGPAASDGYRTFQFGGDFQDPNGTNATPPNDLTLVTTSNIITITSPTCAGATSFATSLKEASESCATSTGDRLFQLGGYFTDTLSSVETYETSTVVTSAASLVQGSVNLPMFMASGNVETDGDVMFITGGRYLNSDPASPASSAFYISIAQPAVTSNTDAPRGWNGGTYPNHGCAATASDGAVMLVAGGILMDDQYQTLRTPQSTITRYGFRLPGNARSFGTLTQARVRLSGGSDGSRAVFVGGCNKVHTVDQGAVTNYSTMDMVNISTPANATNFGTVQSVVYNPVSFGGTSGWVVGTAGDYPSRGYGVASCT